MQDGFSCSVGPTAALWQQNRNMGMWVLHRIAAKLRRDVRMALSPSLAVLGGKH